MHDCAVHLFCSTFNDSVHLQGSGLPGFDSHYMLLALLLNNQVYIVKEMAAISVISGIANAEDL